MRRKTKAAVRYLKNQLAKRDGEELLLLVGLLVVVAITFVVLNLAGEVLEGDTQYFDERILASLRKADDPSIPVGPRWLSLAAEDITALGSATVLGLTVVVVVGFLVLKGLFRNAAFVLVASAGGWLLNDLLKAIFARPRPSVVPHLREVFTLSFPSGHALTSAVVFLTLGALLMHVAERPIVKFYCLAVAVAATMLIGATRVYLGVHYPTDVLAGWMFGTSWALLCWLLLRVLDRRGGLRAERANAEP
jgi:undecaprenyl-diphosphatase